MMLPEVSWNSSIPRIHSGIIPWDLCKSVSSITKERVDRSSQPFALTEDLESEVPLLATRLLVVEAVDSHIDFFQFFCPVVER